MKKNTLRHSLLLLLTAAIWGFAFVAQSVGMDYVQPFTFTAARRHSHADIHLYLYRHCADSIQHGCPDLAIHIHLIPTNGNFAQTHA